MTMCVHGGHDFPVEDETGAYCEEHGVTLLWNTAPLTEDDLAPGAPGRAARPQLVAARPPGAH